MKASVCAALLALSVNSVAGRNAPLHVKTFVASLPAFGVTSTVVYGAHEALLVDAQYKLSGAEKLADQIAASGRRLVAIVITHPDEDHYFGAAALHRRFPDAPIYMTAAALDHFHRTVAKFLVSHRNRDSKETPEAVPTPTVLPSTTITIDGEAIEVITDLQGDILDQTNSMVWVPSLRTMIAGDVVFNKVHPWLADSDIASRARWLRSLDRLASYHPRVVIAGHKQSAETSDDPGVVERMRKYLVDFDANRQRTATPEALIALMQQQYPDWSVDVLLKRSAQSAFSKPISLSATTPAVAPAGRHESSR